MNYRLLYFCWKKNFFFEGWGLDLNFFFNVNCFVFYLHFIIEIALCKRLYDVLRLIFYASIEDLLIDWWFVKFCLFRWEFVGSLIKNNFRLPINFEKRLKLLHRILGLRKRLGCEKRIEVVEILRFRKPFRARWSFTNPASKIRDFETVPQFKSIKIDKTHLKKSNEFHIFTPSH